MRILGQQILLNKVDRSYLQADAETVSFTEVKLPEEKVPDFVFCSDIVIRKGNLTFEISNSASETLLFWIEGLLHVE